MNTLSETLLPKWTPVLQGALQRTALDTLSDLLAALGPRASPETGPSLADGCAGMAILHAYAGRSGLFPSAAEMANQHLERALAALGDEPLPSGLFSGFPGIAWTMQHLDPLAPHTDAPSGFEDEDVLSEVDDALREHVQRTPWRGHYDLVGGLVGMGVYALERLPHRRALDCLVHLVRRLEELARPGAPGLTWWTSPALLPPWQREQAPEGYFNVGVAHGVPGVVWLLAQAARAGVATERARTLAEGGLEWVLAQRLEETPGQSLPAWVVENVPSRPARSAWCYGDPGVALCLLDAARILGASNAEATLQSLAEAAARLSKEASKVRDPGLCHGAAGLAHLYTRLFHSTRNEVFREAAIAWFERTLEMRKPGEPAGGYWSFQLARGARSHEGEIPDASLLTGATGVALALLAGATAVEPQWDRCLLASSSVRY